MPNLSRLTWTLALRGVAALVFGLLALAWPGMVVKTLLVLFVIYSLVDGIALIIGAITTHEHHDDWWLMLIAGILSVAIGAVTILHPREMTAVLGIFIGARAMVVGSLEIAFGFGLRKKASGWLLPVLSGVFSVLFGLVMCAAPLAGIMALVWVIGVFAIVGAAGQMLMAAEVRHWGKQQRGDLPS